MMGISATDGICQVPVMWIISSLARVHFRTSYASAQDVVWWSRVLTIVQLLQVFVVCRLILCINSLICTTSRTASREVYLIASEKCLWLILSHAICESRGVWCCCIRRWGVKLPMLPRSGRHFYILVVSVRLTSACRVGGMQLDSRKKIPIYSNLRVPICEVRRIVYREKVLPGGKKFGCCGTQGLVLLQTACKENDQ